MKEKSMHSNTIIITMMTQNLMITSSFPVIIEKFHCQQGSDARFRVIRRITEIHKSDAMRIFFISILSLLEAYFPPLCLSRLNSQK